MDKRVIVEKEEFDAAVAKLLAASPLPKSAIARKRQARTVRPKVQPQK
jgi:hypothetical protein